MTTGRTADLGAAIAAALRKPEPGANPANEGIVASYARLDDLVERVRTDPALALGLSPYQHRAISDRAAFLANRAAQKETT